MNTKYLLLIFICIFWFNNVFSQNDTITFNSLLQSLEQNFKLKENAFNADSVYQLKNRINNTSYLPQLNLITQATYQSDVTSLPISIPHVTIPTLDKDQYKVALEANQIIYDGSLTKIVNKRDALSAELEAAQSKVNLTNLKDMLNKWTYLYLTNNKIKEQLQEQKNILQKKQSEVEHLISGGLATITDLDMLQVELLKIEQQIDALNNTCNGIISNIELLTSQKLEDKTIKYENEDVTTSDTIQRCELSLYEKRENIALLNAQFASKKRLPQVVAFGQTGYGKPGLNMLSNEFDTYYLVGLKMVLNVYDWGRSSKEKKIALLNQKSIRNEQELFKQNVQLQQNELISSINKIEQWMEKDLQIIELRNKIVQATNAKLLNGTAKITDYLSDLNAKTQALIDLEKHKIEKKYYIQAYKIVTGIK
ncbi:MAG TPA: TolC family protein [Bacteroidales bacterium]|nr:TolC family protein [Bacteroidales bacterium]